MITAILELVGKVITGASVGAAVSFVALVAWQLNQDRIVVRNARLKRIRAQLREADERRLFAKLADELAADDRRLCEELGALPVSDESDD